MSGLSATIGRIPWPRGDELHPAYPEQHDHQAVAGHVLADRLNPCQLEGEKCNASERVGR